MPTRISPNGPTTTKGMTQDDSQTMVSGLQFNEPLSWRAGKAIPVAELLRRLQTLSNEMMIMEQEEHERESFTKVARELASPNLLRHKDKGVRAWTATCLVDILRLCAPDAPFTGQQLRDIFDMIISSILPALSDPSHAYNKQHMYVLQSLAQVKSIVLVTDLPSSERLITSLFTTFFDVLSVSSRSSNGEHLGKNVEHNMTSILVIMVDESTVLPTDAIDVIIAQFLRVDPHVISTGTSKGRRSEAATDNKQPTLVLKEFPPAYNMAKTICNSCPGKMAREISKYFNDVILGASTIGADHPARRNSDDSEGLDEVSLEPTEEDLKELRKAHRLLRELWRASPSVLQNVVPQLEAELSAENVHLRLLATETLGDMVSGIGAAGPPPSPLMDPAAYPPLDLSSSSDQATQINLLTTPSSPQPFPQAHSHAYSSFLSRRQDKSPSIRSAWTTAIGRILATSAGGVGLIQADEQKLVEDLARMLNDSDEKVRLAAVKAVGELSFRDVLDKLGPSGSVDTPGSVLGNFAERVKDRKQVVRVEAMTILGKIWGVGIGEMSAGNGRVTCTLKGAPSKILNTFYANDPEVKVLLDYVFYGCLLPLSYPPIKPKSAKLTNGSSQNSSVSQRNGKHDTEIPDPDKIRTERILMLVSQLDERAKKVFFGFTMQQKILSKYFAAYLQSCEDYNGGVMDKNTDQIKGRLTALIKTLAALLPDVSKASADLWKFARMHDRRSYQLIRFSTGSESDYRTVYKAIKELTKRIESSTAATVGIIETLTPLLYRSGNILYNKSHVPAILEFCKTDGKGLGSIAHELLKDVSTKSPEILKAHIDSLCGSLVEDAPTAENPNAYGAVDDLRACAAFAQKFPTDVPQDHRFHEAMTRFAMYGSPPEAAKHAVSIQMAVARKKDALATDLIQKCVDKFEYGGAGFLSRLAALSQLCLVAPAEIEEHGDTVIDIAVKEILLQVRNPSTAAPETYLWSSDLDIECTAKCWALKIIVNRLRSHPNPGTLPSVAEPIYTLLSTLVAKEGELSPSGDTPPTHKPQLRLRAARLFLKLSTSKAHEVLLNPSAFNQLAEVAQDALFPVRSSFLHRLQKYLTQTKLPSRFYTILFLLAFEPDPSLKSKITTWIRSRVTFLTSVQSQASSLPSVATTTSRPLAANKASTLLESVFARLLSLLAHHPDYNASAEDLVDFARYIVFYLSSVANESNISLIFHIAQRVKGCRDVISTPDLADEFSHRLYTLSDLAQLTINLYIEAHGWSLHTLPTFTKLTLPRSLFKEIGDHEAALDVADKNFLPGGVRDGVEGLIKVNLRTERDLKSGRKRKSEGGEEILARTKRAKAARAFAIRERKSGKTAQKRKSGDTDDWEERDDRKTSLTVERRTSRRVSGVSYVEQDDSEDDKEMEELSEERAAWTAATSGTKNQDDEGGDLSDPGEDDVEAEEEEDCAAGKAGLDSLPQNATEIEGEDDVGSDNAGAEGERWSSTSGPRRPETKSRTKASPGANAKGKTMASSTRMVKSAPAAQSKGKNKGRLKPMRTKSPNTRLGGRATRSNAKAVVETVGDYDAE